MNDLEPILCLDILDTHDRNIIRVADLSEWKHLDGEPTYIDITTPGRKNPITLNFEQGKINYYNSDNLSTDCNNCGASDCKNCSCKEQESDCNDNKSPKLSDGIYKLTLYVCEGDKFSYTMHYLRTVNLLFELDKILIDLYAGCCLPKDIMMQKYLDIDLLIQSAHANLRDGNIKMAACNYEKAVEKTEDFQDCLDENNACTRT